MLLSLFFTFHISKQGKFSLYVSWNTESEHCARFKQHLKTSIKLQPNSQKFDRVPIHAKLGCPQNNFKKFGSNENNRNRICSAFVSVHFKKQWKSCFGVSNVFKNNRNKQFCFKMNQIRPNMYITTTKTNRFVSKWTKTNQKCM